MKLENTIRNYDISKNVFYVNRLGAINKEIEISCKLTLSSGDNAQSVNTALPVNDYLVYRFVNPFLTAQNDLFKLKYDDKSIGYILPAASLEDDDNSDASAFSEILQAYKYYCISNIIKTTDLENVDLNEVDFKDIIDIDSVYIIIYKRAVKNIDFSIINFLPSLAHKGYYFYADGNISDIKKLSTNSPSQIVIDHYLKYRGNNKNISISSCRPAIENNLLIQLLYTKLLCEIDNPLHRFLIIYQVIEHLLEQNVESEINSILEERSNMSNFKFLESLKNVYNTRSSINKLFNVVIFDEKEEITQKLIAFNKEFDIDYNKSVPGECLYDIRNLIFHDFKSVLTKNKEDEIRDLVIQCEILIHQLLMNIFKYDEPKIEESEMIAKKNIINKFSILKWIKKIFNF
ncbi:hypothetical protein [Chryseobacterium chendengshani]|uniref:hypothetical protein n=1 Tax=Chryseobacterium sp. LJ756 TaxID=2864113 RepID=UPI001C63D049|nr:hypothetical protein [Chryseobacterium sp. LJ756]MBW7674204.1 hypothetical protein [Chryseobacterium sp. LJ756]